MGKISEALTTAEEEALVRGQHDPKGRFNVSRTEILDRLVGLGFATRVMVEGPPGSTPEPGRYSGVITDKGRAELTGEETADSRECPSCGEREQSGKTHRKGCPRA